MLQECYSDISNFSLYLIYYTSDAPLKKEGNRSSKRSRVLFISSNTKGKKFTHLQVYYKLGDTLLLNPVKINKIIFLPTSNNGIILFNIFFCPLKNFFWIKFRTPIFMATKCHHLTSVVTTRYRILFWVKTAFFVLCRLKGDMSLSKYIYSFSK